MPPVAAGAWVASAAGAGPAGAVTGAQPEMTVNGTMRNKGNKTRFTIGFSSRSVCGPWNMTMTRVAESYRSMVALAVTTREEECWTPSPPFRHVLTEDLITQMKHRGLDYTLEKSLPSMSGKTQSPAHNPWYRTISLRAGGMRRNERLRVAGQRHQLLGMATIVIPGHLTPSERGQQAVVERVDRRGHAQLAAGPHHGAVEPATSEGFPLLSAICSDGILLPRPPETNPRKTRASQAGGNRRASGANSGNG